MSGVPGSGHPGFPGSRTKKGVAMPMQIWLGEPVKKLVMLKAYFSGRQVTDYQGRPKYAYNVSDWTLKIIFDDKIAYGMLFRCFEQEKQIATANLIYPIGSNTFKNRTYRKLDITFLASNGAGGDGNDSCAELVFGSVNGG
jgi:hypothetical protein